MDATVKALQMITARDKTLLPRLAGAARGKKRNHIASDVKEIYPDRPDLAAAIEFSPGWLVGTNISNRDKTRLVRKACEIYGLRFGADVVFELPNA